MRDIYSGDAVFLAARLGFAGDGGKFAKESIGRAFYQERGKLRVNVFVQKIMRNMDNARLLTIVCQVFEILAIKRHD